MLDDYQLANESSAAFFSTGAAYEDRQLFVHNLGVLLSQTRERIIGAELDDNECVHVYYKGGHVEMINVRCNSYMAIIRDVTKNL